MNEKPIQNLRGKWAKGIVPRNFTWILTEQLAICERLGGYGESHRSVRRQEEIIWVLNSEFTYVVSLIPGPANLHNYEELKLPHLHRPLAETDEFSIRLPEIYRELRQRLELGERLLFHREEINDLLAGFIGGYVAWTGMVPDPPKAVQAAESLLERVLGPMGREMVSIAAEAAQPRK